MKPIKSFLFVIATIAAAICEGNILQWRVSRVYDEFGNTPTPQSFVGYFVPTYGDLNGQLVDREVVLEMLRHGDIQSARAYMVGETYVGFNGNMSNGQFFDYVSEAGQTVSGFAVVFDSPSIETATKFAATEEQSQSVGYTGATKTTFSFANSIGIDAWETIGSATSGYEYLGGTWYYSANGDGTLTITGVEPGSSKALTIPDAIDGCPVTVVGDNAFDNYTTITNVVIPSSITSIGDSAFHGCSGLRSVTITNSVMNIGSYAFYNCRGLTSVTIPDSVTNIGDHAFYNCSGLKNVTIPDSVTSIGSYVFSCSGLTSVTIPDSVTSIGSYVFSSCSKLTSVTIPNSVTSIGSYAFYKCRGLTSVTIPDSVTNIGDHAFSDCSGLKSVTIPNSVTNIGDHAFSYCNGLTSVTIPDSVTSIGSYVFSGCRGLTSVTIPDSVTSIGDSAFHGCTNVCEATVPGRKCGIPFGYVTNLVISAGTTNIEVSAFSGCTSLTSVTIPDSVTSIGEWAFSGCRGLKSVTIPNSVTSISDYAFSGCTNVCEATVPGRKCGIPFDYVTNLVVSAGTTNIEVYAFEGCSGLTSVTIPDSVTSIGNGAFSGCSGLTSVTIPDSVSSIDNGAFSGCSGLTSVTIPDSVTSIGDIAFWGCSGLADINGFVIVRNTICSYHGSGGDIVVPDSVTNIGGYAFSGCSGLTSVTIPDSVTNIGDHAFYDCSGLTSVTIPDSVMNIVDHAFSGCRCLTSVTFEGDAPVLGNSVFNGVSADCTVFVSCDSKGWGVDIPGEWNGLPIDYFDGEPEPDPEPEVHMVIFDFGEHGKGFVDGELVGGAIEQMVPDGEPVDPPVVVPDEGWLFFDWVGEFDVGEPITCDTGFVAMYVEEPMPPTADLNYAIESLYIKQGDLRDGNLEIHVAFNLREGFDWLDVADALQNQCDIRVLSGSSYNNLWWEDWGESQSLVFDNDSETLIATVALSGIASRRYYRIVVHDMVDGVFSTDIGMLVYRDGEYVFVTGAAVFEGPEPTKIVECEDWFSMSPLTVSTADCVRFHYDLDEINSVLWGYTRRDREYSEPFYAVVVNEDLGIEHIAKVNIETLLSDWVSDTIPNAGYFDWDVYYSTVFPGERYMVGFLPESYIDGDHVIDDFWLLEDFAGWLFEVSVTEGERPPEETHTVTFYVGEYGERIGGGELVQTVADGETAVVPEVQTNEDRLFIGWDGDVTAPVTDDIAFTAMYHTAYLWLNFHCGDHGLIGIEGVREYDFSAFPVRYPYSGSSMWARIDENGEYTSDGNRYQFSLLSPPIIDYEGWHCIGWRNSEDGEFFPINNYDEEGGHLYSNAYVSVTLPVDSCLENSPEWVDFEPVYVEVEPPAETYAVTFDLGGHGVRTGGGELVQSVPFGETAVAPLVLADEGWSFTGWNGDVTAAVTGDVVFSAQWERAKINVRINGEETICDYGDMVTFTASEPWDADGVQIVTLGTTFTDPVVTNAFTVTVTNGFEFVWDIFATNWWFEVAETQNGSIAGAETGWIADGETLTLTAVPAEHYHFVGWTGDTEGCVETNGTELAVAMDHPRTVGAEFAIDTFTVTFEAGAHGSLVGEAVQTIDYGGTAAVPEVTSDVGYEFTGWSGDVAASVVGDATFTAQYATIPYAITYTGLKGAAHPNPATYTVEDTVTFAAPGEVYGWVFTGWTPASIAAGSTGSIEVTANWERAKFDVTVNGETRQYSYEEEATFTAPEPWEAEGVQIVTLGTTFTAPVLTNEFSLVVTSDISFEWDVCATNYWLEVAEPEHGSIVGAESGWQPAYSEVIFEPVADEGYHFAGWTGDMADCAFDGDMLAVEMRGPKSIGAEFALDIVAVIDGISPVSPSEDDAIILQGRAENGTAQEYLWRAVNMASGKASVIGRAQVCRAKLPMGEWRLEFLAKDLFGAWSAPASRDVTVSATTAAPDLQIARADVSFVDSLGLPTSHVKTGDAVAVRAVVVNRGAARLQNGAMAYLCDGIIPVADLAGLSRSDSRVIAQGTVSPLGAGRSQTVEFVWDVGRNAVSAVRAYDDGPNAFTVAVVPVGDAAQERTIENNLASMMLEIGESGESPSAMLRASANCHDQIWEGEEYSVSGYVWYERNEHRAMMAGASVLLSIDGEVVAETLTDAYGFYVCSFVAPPAGSHEAVIKAIDGTVVYSGACEFSSLERQGSGESGGEGAEPGIDVPVLRGANIAVAAVECTGVEVRRESAAAYAAYVDEDVGVRATILNTGDVAVTNGFVVSFLMTPEVGGSASQVDVAIADEILPGGTIVVACPETLTPQDEIRWVVRVVADAEDAVLEYSETDNSGRVWLAVEERRPNLVVTGISLSDQRPCDGTDEVVNVHVRNVGSAPVTESFEVELSVGDADRRMIVDGGLPVGGEATVETLVRLYDWMTRIVATADADGVIAEDDESDNSYSRTVLVYPVEANVSPVALSASTYPRVGQTCVLTATFRNDGGTAYSGGTAAFYDGDSAIGEGVVGPIAWKGGTGQATCAWTPAGNDDHSVRVVLDGKTYTVKFSKTPPPDLRVVADDISFEPGTPSAGEAVRFRAMVRNVGSSMPATDVSVAFSVAASDGIYRALTTMKVPTIAAGGSVAVDADMPFVVEQGVYSVQVAVCDGEGREADPADNLAVRTFGVNMPVASATAEATCIVGDTITLDGTGSTGATGFRWTLLEAPTGGISDVPGCTSAVASFVPHVAGVYRFALVVSDGTHESAPAECVVIIDRVRVAATASSGGTVSHDGEAVYAAGAVVVFEAIPETHYHFVGWTGDVDGCEAVGDLRLAVVMDCNRTIYAEFALDEIPVGEAANAPRLEWFSDGAAAWFGEWSADAADGEHAARSGAIGDNSSSVLGVKLHGAGTLAFDWRALCEAKYDALRLEVDGKLLRNISGETGWKNVTVELGVGDHEVRWVYAKGRSRSEGQDAVWLDNVSWTPAGVPTLAEALGDFEWVTDGDVSWTAIRNEYAYEGDSFAYADGLGDYEYASLRTTVSGAGRLVFRWAVSCEYWCDWFDFMVDGEVMEMLTGETDWLEVSVDLADGPHELEWVYWKDEMDYDELAGTNCAMLDYVQWFPAGEEPPVVSEETVSEFFAWLKEHRRLDATDTIGDAAAMISDETPVSSKGMTLYQEFVAGTNPDDENDVFTAEIKVSADGVSVTPHPNLGDKRVYTLLGRKTLGGSADDWVEVRAGEEANYNFFKVTVDIK